MAQISGRAAGHGSPRVAAQLSRIEGAAQRTYRLYMEHLQTCTDCGHGKTRCSVAIGLQRAAAEARDGQR